MTVIQAAILIGALVTIVAWPQILHWLGMRSGTAALMATVIHWTVVLIMVLLSLALAFYVGPDADQRWEWITPGSLAGAFVFMLASYGFRLYVQKFANYDKTYGPLGGVMVLMFWFWISSVVLLASAQINKVIEDASPLGKNYGQKVDPSEPPDFKSIEPEPASPDAGHREPMANGPAPTYRMVSLQLRTARRSRSNRPGRRRSFAGRTGRWPAL